MMKRTLQWRKILNTLAIGLALLLLGMIFGGILQYGWDKETMRITVTTDEKKADSKNTTGGAILETGTENGMKIIKTKLTSSEYESYGVSSSSETAYTLTATVTPEDTADKAVDWSVGFVDPTSTWAVGKRATDYVTITPETDGGIDCDGVVYGRVRGADRDPSHASQQRSGNRQLSCRLCEKGEQGDIGFRRRFARIRSTVGIRCGSEQAHI